MGEGYMAGRITKCFTGIQDDDKDAYRRDTVLTSIRSEAVISAEVGLTSYRVGNHDDRRNDEAIRL